MSDSGRPVDEDEVKRVIDGIIEESERTRDDPMPDGVRGVWANRLGQHGPTADYGDQAHKTYLVRAVPWEHGHELYIEGVGVTQTHRDHADTAEQTAQDYLAALYGGEPKQYRVQITPD